ncbi:MAG: ABC transporter permease subunit [Coriobacteriia bacterium]|nr:ABC transporter permease subunit [Coriobacteriia bacterium]
MERIVKTIAALLAALGIAFGAAPGAALAQEGAAASGLVTATSVSTAEQQELLSRASIAALGGSLTEIRLEKSFPEADRQAFSTSSDCIQALVAGKVDYCVCPEPTARLFIKENPELTYLDPAFYSIENSFLVKKGNDDLRSRIDEALDAMRESGELDSIYDKWVFQNDYSTDDIPVREDGEVLRVACCATVEPNIFYKDGQVVGADAEIIQRVAYELGMRVEFTDMPFASELASVSSGMSDVALGYSYSEERAQQVDFTGAYATNSYVFVTRPENLVGVASTKIAKVSVDEQYALLAEGQVGTTEGTFDSVELASRLPEGRVLYFSSDVDSLAALDAGKVDYASVGEPYAALFQRNNPGYVRMSPSYLGYTACLGISKGNTELRERIDEVLLRMEQDGTLDELYQKWIVEGDYDMSDVPENDSGEVLRVVATTANEPQSFIHDGEYAGLDCEVVERVAYELGMRVEYVDINFSGSIAAVASGKADLVLGPAPTEERKEQIDFTRPYLQTGCCIVYRDEAAQDGSLLQTFAEDFTATFLTEDRWRLVVGGLGVTLGISVGSFALATVGGAGLCAAGRSKKRWLRAFARGYGKLCSGIPVLVWLMVLYYIVFANAPVPAAAVAVLCFGLVASGGVAGIFETGLTGVARGEVEAAWALGFSRLETFWRVVAPQAAQNISGLYAGEFVGLLKQTSIVGYVAIMDLTKASDVIRSRTFNAFFPLISTALVYFAVIALCTWLLGRAARRLDPRRRSEKRVLRGIERRQCAIMPH